MNKNLLLGIAIVAVTTSFGPAALAQTGMAVNTTGAVANSSAMLDVSSTTQGMLIPRMTNAFMTGIASPATGLLLYCTDCTPVGFYYYTGSAWTSLSAPSNTTTQGNTFNGASQLVQLNSSSNLPAVGGNSLTNLNASNLGTGTVPTARLGSGTASTSTFLRGDNSWAAAGGGTVTSVSGNPLTSGTTAFVDTMFHVTIITSTTTPQIFFSENNALPYGVWGNMNPSPNLPTYGKVYPQALNTLSGAPSSATFYRGDGAWATPATSSVWAITDSGAVTAPITGSGSKFISGGAQMYYIGSDGLNLYLPRATTAGQILMIVQTAAYVYGFKITVTGTDLLYAPYAVYSGAPTNGVSSIGLNTVAGYGLSEVRLRSDGSGHWVAW